MPSSVPAYEAEQLREGRQLLHATVSQNGKAAVSAAGWQADYQLAQNRLRARYPIMTSDAILWRNTFLDLLLGWEEFQARHQNDGELPTASMLKVAATIPTYGDDTSFDIDLFEEEQIGRAHV